MLIRENVFIFQASFEIFSIIKGMKVGNNLKNQKTVTWGVNKTKVNNVLFSREVLLSMNHIQNLNFLILG